MQLSKRLQAISDMVTAGNRVIDVGTDHAYLPISLIEEKKCPSALAMDINQGPLHIAETHIHEQGLGAYIETRLSDGVQALTGAEGETLIIAGMGGGLIRKILEEGKEKLTGIREFILQPQSEVEAVRTYLAADGYKITQEAMIQEEGKYYPVMKAVRGQMQYDHQIHYKYGYLLLHSRDEVLHGYLLRQQQTYMQIRARLKEAAKESGHPRLLEIAAELELIEEALLYYES